MFRLLRLGGVSDLSLPIRLGGVTDRPLAARGGVIDRSLSTRLGGVIDLLLVGDRSITPRVPRRGGVLRTETEESLRERRRLTGERLRDMEGERVYRRALPLRRGGDGEGLRSEEMLLERRRGGERAFRDRGGGLRDLSDPESE